MIRSTVGYGVECYLLMPYRHSNFSLTCCGTISQRRWCSIILSV